MLDYQRVAKSGDPYLQAATSHVSDETQVRLPFIQGWTESHMDAARSPATISNQYNHPGHSDYEH